MAKRIKAACFTLLASLCLALPAMGQPVKVQIPTDTNLNTYFKELQGRPVEAEALYKTGRKVAAVCALCHGDGGNSLRPDVPNLSGQNPAYLLEQMRQFAVGERRNEFMQGLIKSLSQEEKIGMVVFYARQEVSHKPTTNPALAAKGQEYYSKNCLSCHGEHGRGNETIARIAGQQSEYLKLTLKRYREGSSVRKESLMTPNARQMADADIAAVVAYLSSMQ